MAVHELAGTKVRKEDYIDLKAIAAAYHTTHPDVADPHQQVRFGTSGHRGQAGNGSFTQDHVAAITQAVCNFRKQFGAEGPLFVGEDTHYLSKLAYETVLSVLAANGVTAYVDSVGDFVPTPSVSRAILRYNSHREDRLADGLIITRPTILRNTAASSTIPSPAARLARISPRPSKRKPTDSWPATTKASR